MSLRPYLGRRIRDGKCHRWHDLHCNQKHSYQETDNKRLGIRSDSNINKELTSCERYWAEWPVLTKPAGTAETQAAETATTATKNFIFRLLTKKTVPKKKQQ